MTLNATQTKKIARKAAKAEAKKKVKCVCGAEACKIVRKERVVTDRNYGAMRWFPDGIVDEECEVVAVKRARLRKVSDDVWHMENDAGDKVVERGVSAASHLYEKFLAVLPEIELFAKEHPKKFAEVKGLQERMDHVKKFAVDINEQLVALQDFADKTNTFIGALESEL